MALTKLIGGVKYEDTSNSFNFSPKRTLKVVGYNTIHYK